MRANKKNERSLSHERLLNLLSYNKETGIFTWISNPSSGPHRMGKAAGALRPNGYIQIKIDGVHFMAQRLAWFYVYKEWPHETIDHKNLIKSDNWIDNLRLATYGQNRANTGVMLDNALGIKGVVWRERDQRFQAQITSNKKQIHLGYFKSKKEAQAAYIAAAKRLHKSFARFT